MADSSYEGFLSFLTFHEPTFCEYYKPLLVEEIALANHPSYVHYGKCAVIGKLAQDDNALESLCIPALPSRLQIPDGTSSIDLVLDNYYGSIARGRHVEVTGIVKLRDRTTENSTNSGFLQNALLRTDRSKYQLQYAEMKNRYRPFIEVDDIQTISNARELISCNLKMRRIKLPKEDH